jgi:hypothetical protein
VQNKWENLRDVYRRELKKLHDTKSGQAAQTTHESKWQYFTMIMFMNTVMNSQPPLSNVPAASSVLRSTRNLEDGNGSTNVSINDNDKFSEGVFYERQVKKNLGTNRKINFQEKALNLKKRMIKLMEERPMKESQANKDYHVSGSFTIHKRIGQHSKIGTRNRTPEQSSQENSN